MSEVDTRFSPETRAGLLDEVRAWLPAFLSAAATEQYDPAGDVRELLGLDEADLRRVVAVHLCLSAPVRTFLDALAEGLRRPITSSERPPVVGQAVRGAVDWGATIRQRAVAGGDRTLYVTRPAQRVFDVPENRALAWLLRALDGYLRRAVGSALDADDEGTRWDAQLRAARGRLALAWRHPWLRGIEPERPSAATLRRLRAARNAFYAVHVPDAVLALMRWGEHPTEDDITQLLCERWFRPSQDWRLFEVVVALRLARAFAAASPVRRRARLLYGSGGAPYARYTLAGGDEVRLHYQGWPPSTSPSVHAEARARHQLRAGAPRPDVCISRHGGAPDAAVLELKATTSAGYLGDGLSQLLGYLAERPDQWTAKPSGWLVAPASSAFVAADPGGAELWIVSADDVAEAAVARFAL